MQTPQFTLSNAKDDSANVNLELTVRHGVITDGFFSVRNPNGSASTRVELDDTVVGHKLHELHSWEGTLSTILDRLEPGERAHVTGWLQQMLPHVTTYS